VSGAACPDPNRVEAVDLDDVTVVNQVEILASGGLSTLCALYSHDLDEASIVDDLIARPDEAGEGDLGRGT
jgi:hypothetical protein